MAVPANTASSLDGRCYAGIESSQHGSKVTRRLAGGGELCIRVISCQPQEGDTDSSVEFDVVEFSF